MKLRGTLILFGIALVLFIFVYAFELRKPGGTDENGKNLGKKLMIQQDSVSKIELSYANSEYETIISSKDASGNWQIEKPISARADKKEIDKIISSVIGKSIQSTLKEQVAVAEYGLDNPRVTATFYLKDGDSKTLLLGNTVPTGNYAYAQQKSESEIIIVPASLADDLTRFVADIRDKSVISLEKSAIQRIKMQHSGQKSIICEQKRSNWEITAPMTIKADNNAVDKIISDLIDLKVEKFVDDNPADLSVYGLSQPQLEIVLTTTEGLDKSLLIGKQENDQLYAKIASENPVFLISSNIVIPDDPNDLRDRTVIAFDKDAVDKLELKNPKNSIVIEKKAEGTETIWEITAPVKVKADKSKIEGILNELDSLRIRDFVSDKPENLAMYGLSQPQIQITLSIKGFEPKTLVLGQKIGESVYAKTASVSSVYTLDAVMFTELNKGIMELRDLQVMKFKTDDVKRMELKKKSGNIAFIRQERDWRIVEPTKEKANSYEINNILNKLSDLKTDKFLADGSSEYGLVQPEVEVTLTFANNSVKKLVVGKKLADGNSAYAKVDKDIFIIGKDVVDELMKDVKELREGN